MNEVVGRNDPCPCGSGKKYKRCCANKDDVARRAAQEHPDVDEVLGPDASIYDLWLRWRAARKISDFNLLYDMIRADSALAERLGDRAAFIADCDQGTALVPSGEATFRHLRIVDGARAKLLQTVGDDDAANPRIRCECLDLEKTERGWRLTDFAVVEVAKAEHPKVGLELFGA
jgi:hypothetical protein